MDPKIYPIDQHRIARKDIDPDAVSVIQRLRAAGHLAYLVGGGVRDLLLGEKPKDFDVSTSATPEEIRSLFRNAILIGRRFRLAHIRFGKKVIEVATFRAGETEAHELIVRDNSWGSEEEDVLRRDFTINGLFYDPAKEVVIDYVEGFLDLEKRILRTIGKAEARFIQDPVRMIRLIKFSARFNFSIEPATFEALLSCKNEIIKSSSHRVLEELFRMLESGASKPFFHLLHQYGMLHALLPELAHFFDTKAHHQTFSLLDELDAEVKKEMAPKERSLLLGPLLFPLFDAYLQDLQKGEERPLHLGKIGVAAHYVIESLFEPFFQLPKRIRGILSSILVSQYRFTPLGETPKKVSRLPRDPAFPLSLSLFKLRASLDPSLFPHYTEWREALSSIPTPTSISIPERRRRRRRRA